VNQLRFESTGFGWLVADGTRYTHDVLITLDAQVMPRPKHLSKKYGGWHTVLGPEEIQAAIAGSPEILIVGCGQFSLLPICEETRALAARLGVQIKTASTPQAIAQYEHLMAEGKRVAAILHVTC
jgi:hypothetical protein